ncbi:MAG: Uma2 family endonuclease [Microcoleaceae cyanobacterium]
MRTIQTPSVPKLYVTPEIFCEICKSNPDLRLERTARGELIVNPPTGSETGKFNLSLAAWVWLWNEQTQLGAAFDSSSGFEFPNGATRSPDVSWIQIDRWNALTPEQQGRFAPIAPDFVIELMSPNDSLRDAQEKMQEYMDNQVRLGWLINRVGQTVEIYRLAQAVQTVKIPYS